jgi:hypothetical protein
MEKMLVLARVAAATALAMASTIREPLALRNRVSGSASPRPPTP